MMTTYRTEHIQQLYRAHFPSFARFAFRALHPNKPLMDNWHLDVVCEALQACVRGEIKRLIINLPPRYLKSHCASVALPAWLLGQQPNLSILSLSGSSALRQSLHQQTLGLMQSPRYQALFGGVHIQTSDHHIQTMHGGGRLGLRSGDTLIGLGADVIIVDDPMTAKQAKNKRSRKQINAWFDDNVTQRLKDQQTGVVIVVMQRVHTKDMTAHLLGRSDAWAQVSLPAIASADECHHLQLGRQVRRKRGEALHSAVESKDQLRQRLRVIGPSSFRAQYQQSPYKQQTHQGDRIHNWHEGSGNRPWQRSNGAVIAFGLCTPEVHIQEQEIFGEPYEQQACDASEYTSTDEWLIAQGIEPETDAEVPIPNMGWPTGRANRFDTEPNL